MKDAIRVPVDFDEICFAFGDNSMVQSYFLDLETGEIIFMSELIMDPEELEELEEKIDGMIGERYIPIPRISSRETFDHMVAFCETVKDENLRQKLQTSLGGKGSFSRFKDLILNHPEERERWFEFHNNKVAEQVRKWLEAGNIELVEPEPIEIVEISYDELAGCFFRFLGKSQTTNPNPFRYSCFILKISFKPSALDLHVFLKCDTSISSIYT